MLYSGSTMDSLLDDGSEEGQTLANRYIFDTSLYTVTVPTIFILLVNV